MARYQDNKSKASVQQVLLDDPGFLQGIVGEVLQRLLDSEITAHVGATPYERSGDRKGYRNGSYPRTLKTRVGRIELSVPRDREGTFQPSLFARYQRSEKALLLALMEMTLEGVSTRKVAAITEALCGTSFSKSLVSSLAADLDDRLEAWRNRRLDGEWPYLFVDALYQKVRHDGRVVSMALLVVVGVNGDGYRSVLAVEVAHSENEADYDDLFRALCGRGLRGVQMVVSDDHQGLKSALIRNFPGVAWQRCQVHFARNLLMKLRRRDRGWVMAALRDVFNAPDRAAAEFRLRGLVERLRSPYPDLADYLEEEAPETLSVFDYPEAHRRRLRTTNGLERLNQELRRRMRVIRIFPHRWSCLRLSAALCQEHDEEWMTGKRYLDMTLLSKNVEGEVVETFRRAG